MIRLLEICQHIPVESSSAIKKVSVTEAMQNSHNWGCSSYNAAETLEHFELDWGFIEALRCNLHLYCCRHLCARYMVTGIWRTLRASPTRGPWHARLTVARSFTITFQRGPWCQVLSRGKIVGCAHRAWSCKASFLVYLLGSLALSTTKDQVYSDSSAL